MSNHPSDPVRVGMIGVWNFGKYRRQKLRETGLFRVVACCDRNPEFLKQACEEEGGAIAFDDYAAMLRAPGLEGVVISTGADSHAALAIAALDKGLHVFVEKPLCTRPQEVRALTDAAARSGKVFGMGHSSAEEAVATRLFPRWAASGKLGVVAAYEANTSHGGGLRIQPGDWRGLADKNPGGMLFQCGVHVFHDLVHLFGPVESVCAMMRYDVNPNTQTADAANVLIRHRGGMVGTLNCYHVTAYCHEARFFGTKGNLYADTFTGRAWFQERLGGPVESRVEVEVPAAPPNAGCLNLIRWHDAIRRAPGCPPASPSLQDGIDAVMPVFAAEISAKERREVRLDEVFGGE